MLVQWQKLLNWDHKIYEKEDVLRIAELKIPILPQGNRLETNPETFRHEALILQ